VTNNSITIDGNTAAARVAHRTSEVIAIYPITPSSPMAELAETWSAAGERNIWGSTPRITQMQSEAGVAGAAHGSLLSGALTTTFTASQGLLLMLPNMYKIAGELTPAVFHVAARTVATHALSIFGDHSDVMAARSCGWSMLCASSVQEAQDFALISLAVTLESRVPVLHFFDGFRTSHEINTVVPLDDDVLRAMLNDDLIDEFRDRALNPDRPVLRGSAQNPDVFFQAREACSPFYAAVPDITRRACDRFAELTGRQYRLFDYVGAPDAERVIVVMGSGSGAVEEVVEALERRGEKVGLLKVRLFRPFDTAAFVAALPPSVTRIAVLDRTKEPGAVGEPLYQDVVTALMEESGVPGGIMPRVIGGRYGLASKEFTPAMAAGIFAELAKDDPRNHFTSGIVDDVSGSSIPPAEDFTSKTDGAVEAVFFGLGSDGTVGATKNSVKIIGEHTDLNAQGYFVYDSKKSGATTISHLRFGAEPIRSTYLITQADFVACHQFHLMEQLDVVGSARPGATLLLNSPYGPDDTWDRLAQPIQQEIIDKRLRVFAVDGHRVARDAGIGNRINTVLQACFFELSGVLPRDEAIAAIKDAIAQTYISRGEAVVERNQKAVDASIGAMYEIPVPAKPTSLRAKPLTVPEEAPDFVQRVTRLLLEGKGDLLPVTALLPDGTFPTGTAKWEKRGLADEIPIWDPSICIDCAKCALVCPHAAIRVKVYEPSELQEAPAGFQHKEWQAKDFAGDFMTIQVAPDDCTGCGICVDVCPARSKSMVKHKAINMQPRDEHLEEERQNFAFFLDLPEMDRTRVRTDTIKGSQLLEPLFEFSGACAGCGETPYLKLLTQMFGDRALIANATGCSSIYGGNLPTTPWSMNQEGRGPAWANSLFEDNAEFGFGMRLALDQREEFARQLLERLAPQVGEDLADLILDASQFSEQDIRDQRERVAELHRRLATFDRAEPAVRQLQSIADVLVRKSVWIVGGDGWAYDIGFGGLDHVLASDRDVNILVLDTEVYSNTGGQASKSTARAAVAKFAAMGKATAKKDLGTIASAYGHVYVANVAMGADNAQTIRAFAEAEAHPGPSLILAYSHCIAHGIDMEKGMAQQKAAVDSGYWPLYRYRPDAEDRGEHPFRLDSRKPTIRFQDFALEEARFAMLWRSNPLRAQRLLDAAQADIDERWHLYEQFADMERHAPPGAEED
jgi:pyruvate-ferredoxin/flavodoxin oxidoreductase